MFCKVRYHFDPKVIVYIDTVHTVNTIYGIKEKCISFFKRSIVLKTLIIFLFKTSNQCYNSIVSTKYGRLCYIKPKRHNSRPPLHGFASVLRRGRDKRLKAFV